MNFKFQNKTFDFPTSLRDIKLSQRIEFNALYGKEIKEKQEAIFDKDEDGNYHPKDKLDAFVFMMDIACKNISYFSGIQLEEVQKIPIEQVMNIYYSCFDVVSKQERELEFTQKHYWNNEIWVIESSEINYESQMTFNEFITAKQIVKSMNDLGQGEWESLPYLCSIFLRKDGEAFDEKYLTGQTSRVELMKELPLDIALCVAFFLGISMNIFSATTRYSREKSEAEKDQIWQTTLMSGVGSAS